METLFICRDILNGIKQRIFSRDFTDRFRMEKRFVRMRKLDIPNLILYLFYTFKSSMNTNLANIRDDLPELNFPDISKQAVSKARQGLEPELFLSLLHFCVELFYSKMKNRKNWNGYYLFAVDGSAVQLPKNPATAEAFGFCRNQHHSREDVMGNISVLYDVLEDIIVDGVIHEYHHAERRAAGEHLDYLESAGLTKRALILMDRGYPSYALFNRIGQGGYYYLMRVQGKIRQLTQLEEPDTVTDYLPMDRKGDPPIKVRAVRVILESGVEEFLVTNIMDPAITPDMFRELYFKRWGIETKYNELKNQHELEEFSGATPVSIRQDYYIKLLFMNLCSLVKHSADSRIKESAGPKNRFQYQANRAFIIARLKKHLPRMLSGAEPAHGQLVLLVESAMKRRSQIQPGRKCKRPRIQLRRRHCNNRKTTT